MIESTVTIEKYTLKPNDPYSYWFDVKKSELDDSRNINNLGMGFTDFGYMFFETVRTKQHKYGGKSKTALALHYQLGEKAQMYQRSVYTVWDLLGDVGGLYGTLQILC